VSGNKGGVAFAVIVVLAIAVAVGFVISPQPTSVLSQVIPPNPAFTNSTTLYANAAGWDTPTSYGNSNGAIPVNPTLNYTVGTVVTFTVIETDTLPHNLYIAKGTSENLAAYYSVIGAINPILGSKYTGEWYAQTPGTYTYWCQVHPTTMVGTINVVAANSSSVISNINQNPSIVSISPHQAVSGVNSNLYGNLEHSASGITDKLPLLNLCPCLCLTPGLSIVGSVVVQAVTGMRF